MPIFSNVSFKDGDCDYLVPLSQFFLNLPMKARRNLAMARWDDLPLSFPARTRLAKAETTSTDVIRATYMRLACGGRNMLIVQAVPTSIA